MSKIYKILNALQSSGELEIIVVFFDNTLHRQLCEDYNNGCNCIRPNTLFLNIYVKCGISFSVSDNSKSESIFSN